MSYYSWQVDQVELLLKAAPTEAAEPGYRIAVTDEPVIGWKRVDGWADLPVTKDEAHREAYVVYPDGRVMPHFIAGPHGFADFPDMAAFFASDEAPGRG
jgi:hypothetical protein